MKILKKILPIIIAVVVAFGIYDFFHITGSEIRNVNKLTEAEHVDVGKDSHSYIHNLDDEQIIALKELLLKTEFTRRIRRTIIGPLPESRYSILADWGDNGKTNLYIHLLGGEYAQVQGQFGNVFIKIKNENFENELKAIIGIE